MGSIAKRSDGRYRARFRDPAGREHAKHFAKKSDAEKWLIATETSKLTGEYVDPRRARVLYRDWRAQWWDTTLNLRPSTRARDETYLRLHVAPVFDSLPLANIGQLEVRRWVAGLSGKGLAPATVVKCYQLLGKSLAAAVDAGYMARTPCRNVPLPRVERSEMRFLTPAEVARLVDVTPARWRALVLLAAYGGLRVGELAGLRRHRVHPLRGTVEVAEVIVEVRGVLHSGPPKTRAGHREVGLPRAVMASLVEHLERYAEPGPAGLVFVSAYGGPLRVPAWRRRVWQPATAAAGLEGLRIHDLRHTAVALWIAAGANPKQIATRAGHTSVSFSLDRYGHLMPGHDTALREALDSMYVESAPGATVTPLRGKINGSADYLRTSADLGAG